MLAAQPARASSSEDPDRRRKMSISIDHPVIGSLSAWMYWLDLVDWPLSEKSNKTKASSEICCEVKNSGLL